MIRLVSAGVRDVAPNTVEAARSFGATRLQVLAKVKIPLARDAIMLGVNQGIIMVLAVVVIGGLVGSGGLGYEVAQGLQRNEFGQGVVASLAILALGIALDRVTQGNRRARQEVDAVERESHIEGRQRRLECRNVPELVGACGPRPCSHSPRSRRSRSSASAGAHSGGVVRHGHAQRAGVGRLDGQHLRRQERAREASAARSNITKIAEIPVYQAMADGKVDAVLEDWQHVDQYKQYITKQKTVVLGGSNGVNGHIGWYIPDYLMKQYPQFKTWKGLKGKESIFKSPESGSQGMFLGGDPSYVQKDQQLIEALGLNFKFVSVGAEPAQVARWTQLVQAEEAGDLLLVHAAVPERAVPPRPR